MKILFKGNPTQGIPHQFLMENPSPKDVRVSVPLTNISLGYRNDDVDYISRKIFPDMPVRKDTAKIVTYMRDNMRIVDSLRAPGDPAREVEHRVTIGDHYDLVDHALKELVSDEVKENSEAPINAMEDATENLTDRIAIEEENALATVLLDAAVLIQNTTLSGTSQWTAGATSDPIGDVKTAKLAVFNGSGKVANFMSMGYASWLTTLNHPQIVDRVRGAAIATQEVLQKNVAAIFGLPNIFVGSAQKETANPGQADAATLGNIWENDIIVGYSVRNPGLKSRTLGLTYTKIGRGRQVKTWREEDREGDFVRVADKRDSKLIDAKCGYLIIDAT